MIESYKRFWSNLGNFEGTSDRPDYWWPAFINYFLGIILAIILTLITGGHTNVYSVKDVLANSIWDVVFIIVWVGTLSLKFRRLHDSDHSAWWILISLIPIIGTIWFFILMLLPTKPNRWSDNYVAED